ncbi:MAG TPA: RDD family protein [Vicinamibacterales bacterium]|nr:RDD family protein [Vicinamibacterales bacterium]
MLTGPGAASRLDLPLFAGGAAPEDAPLITPPAAPRAPLSVRKTSPAHPRARAVPEELFEQNQVSARTRRPPAGRPHELFPSETPDEPEHAPAITPESTGGPRPAPPALRLAAGLIDLLIMGSIDLTVVYLTLRFSGLTSADLAILPKIPLGAFLALLNGGYLVLFTVASGQTIGKMLSGVRVMSLPPGGAPARVSFGTAIVRAAAYLASLLPAGLGLLPILLSPDRRALHDRLAGTCVVKA